jgi:acyl carrier protein
MPASHLDISEKVKKIVGDHLFIENGTVQDSTRFAEDLTADSLDMFEILMELEDTFDLAIPSEIADTFETVGDAIQYIRAKEQRLYFIRPDRTG